MEAELWQIFIDRLEGEVGETEQVQQAREQDTMTLAECQRWWDWAEGTVRARARRARTRDRTRSPRMSPMDGDAASLMEAGRSKPMPKRKGLGGGRRDRDEEDDKDGRRDTRPRNGLSDGRRRSPARRRTTRPMRGSAQLHPVAGKEERSPMPRYTHETRRLLPRGTGRRQEPMSVGNATCFWLHTLGLRDGLATDDRHALDPEGHAGRVRALQEVRPEDVTTIMVALMRTVAMFVVEASQLMMVRVGRAGPAADEEVEVEVDAEEGDEEMWMQTSAGRPVKPTREEVEELAEDEREAKCRRVDLEGQLEERAREEAEQAQNDARLWEQHQAAKYRDWEWWVVENCPPPMTRRLQTTLVLTQAGSAEQVTCSVPLARNRPVELRLCIREVSGELTAEQVNEREAAPMTTEEVYRSWRGGGLTDAAARALVGDEMMAMFMAQQMVEDEAGPEAAQGDIPSQGSIDQPAMSS